MQMLDAELSVSANQKLSAEENMDQIRNTMMQHEALFKEQVQALHRLYGIQRSAMQEMRKRIYSQPQAVAVNYESVVLANNQLQGPVLEGKSVRRVYASAHSYTEERLSLSLHPFCTSEESKACDYSSSVNGRGVETSRAAPSKLVRNFDLEKIPEDCMDESESQTEPKNLNSDQASASKVCEVDNKKLDTSSHNSNSITKKKPMSSNQGSSEFNKLNPVKSCQLRPGRSAEQSKESKFQLHHQYPESDSTSTISTAHKKLEELLKDHAGLFPFTNGFFPQSTSLSLETNLSSGKQTLQSVTLISEIDGENQNSGNGSNDRDEGYLKPEKRDVSRHSFSSSVSDTEAKVTESVSCSNSVTNKAKPLATTSEEQEDDDPSLHDASESIAAEILLSFVPRRSPVNPRGTRVNAEPRKAKTKDLSIDKKVKMNIRGIEESVKWTKSIGRSRSLRRPR